MQHPALDGLGLEWRIGGIAMDGAVELYGRGGIDDITIDRCEQAAFGTTEALSATAAARLVGCPDLPRPAMFSVAVHRPSAESKRSPWFRFAQRMFPDHEGSLTALERWCDDDDRRGSCCRRWQAGVDDGRWHVGLVGVRLDAAGGGQRPGGDPAVVSFFFFFVTMRR